MHKTSTEERQLIKLVEKLSLPEDVKTSWAEQIRNGDMSTELADEIRQQLTTVGEAESDERAQANRTQHLVELTMLVKRWRLSSQSRNFTKK